MASRRTRLSIERERMSIAKRRNRSKIEHLLDNKAGSFFFPAEDDSQGELRNSGTGDDRNSDCLFVRLQQSGTLWVRHLDSILWRKRYCVIKDGFFIWYHTKDEEINGFNATPKGIIPLPECYTEFVMNDNSKMYFEIIHPDIYKCGLRLKASSKLDGTEWVKACKKGKICTWETALLGYNLLQEIETRGTAAHFEKREAVDLLNKKVLEISKQNRDRERIIERERKIIEPLQNKIKETDSLLIEYEKEREELEAAIKKQEKKYMNMTVERKALESKLTMASMTLRRLKQAFEHEFIEPKSPPDFFEAPGKQKKLSTAERNENFIRLKSKFEPESRLYGSGRSRESVERNENIRKSFYVVEEYFKEARYAQKKARQKSIAVDSRSQAIETSKIANDISTLRRLYGDQ